jgi:hypothetical protein
MASKVEVRQDLEELIVRDLLGPWDGEDERIKASPKSRYLVGMLAPVVRNPQIQKASDDGQDGEDDAKAIMEIYKEQQQLREALEKELKKQGVGGNGQNALEQMKQIEKQLLNKGFNNETLQKILNVKYELLKLDKALQQQGEDKKRQSETNKKEYNNQATALPSRLQEYLNSIEILNRQSLPLRSNFNQKVQEYFKTND